MSSSGEQQQGGDTSESEQVREARRRKIRQLESSLCGGDGAGDPGPEGGTTGEIEIDGKNYIFCG